jgi:putative sporulation protein YtxC
VTLLRYFVELQEPKTDMVNVIVDQPESFRILDVNGNAIQTDYLQGILSEINHNEFDFEDYLISALITIAPARIVLHLCQGSRVEQTIISIFGTRVYICDSCAICNAFCKCP